MSITGSDDGVGGLPRDHAKHSAELSTASSSPHGSTDFEAEMLHKPRPRVWTATFAWAITSRPARTLCSAPPVAARSTAIFFSRGSWDADRPASAEVRTTLARRGAGVTKAATTTETLPRAPSPVALPA